MTTTTSPTSVKPLPSLPSVYRSRASVELKEFFRQRESVVFTLMLPVLLLVVFGAVLDFDLGNGVSFIQYFMAGIIAAGILGASLQNMAISIATERSDGTLKSLVGTPMPKSAYFVGKVVQVLAVTVAIIVVLLLIGVVFYGIELPSGADWLTFAWVAALGAAACTLLGIAISSLAKNGRSASATVTPSRCCCSSSRGVLPVRRDPDVDADGGGVLPAEVDGAGAALGLPARRDGRIGAGRVVGAGPDGAGPGCVVHRRAAVVRRDLPLAGPRVGLSYVPLVPAPLNAENVVRAPKVLLHDHLDGGLRPETVLELADEHGYGGLPGADPESLGAWFRRAADSGSLVQYLETFAHTVGVMQQPESIHRVARECALDLASDGVVYAEVRFAPELSTAHGLQIEEVVEAMVDGFAVGSREATEAGTPIRVGALLCAMRQADRWDDVAGLVVRYRDAGVVGFDLAGPEIGFPRTGSLRRSGCSTVPGRTARSTPVRPPASTASARRWTGRVPSGSATVSASPTRWPPTARWARWRSGCSTSR
ncbi:ABC transporter permease [Blastococcus brunescens]|uniref:adenosine deaminase n=1 Tax=Blastococcus brunescens TaxID=1564165 RepID=A0ABZ1AWN3_9ACTN|nr:ABC transporter permease [Blastococcus sp. BMG 8361]WRL62979.1 ABC transporter permease [Blastococcus sp. BMG 8361]